jgi:hypothetical protein
MRNPARVLGDRREYASQSKVAAKLLSQRDPEKYSVLCARKSGKHLEELT